VNFSPFSDEERKAEEMHRKMEQKDCVYCFTCNVAAVQEHAKLRCPQCHELLSNCCGD
jgi:hypothetical protein